MTLQASSAPRHSPDSLIRLIGSLVLTPALATLASACSPGGESVNAQELEEQARAHAAQAGSPAAQAGVGAVEEIKPPDPLPPPPIEPKLNEAFKAAFGSYDSAYVERRLDDGRVEEITFTPDRIVQAPFGPVLLSEGVVSNGGHPSAGKVAVHYLRPRGKGFQVKRAFVPAVEVGSMGQFGDMEVRLDFGKYPMLLTDGGFSNMGVTCGSLVLTELRPERPVELLWVHDYWNDGGMRKGEGGLLNEDGSWRGEDDLTQIKEFILTGKVGRVTKDKSFDMVYSGSRRFTDRYVRKGDRYVLSGGPSKMVDC